MDGLRLLVESIPHNIAGLSAQGEQVVQGDSVERLGGLEVLLKPLFKASVGGEACGDGLLTPSLFLYQCL